ncbi:MAG TPA: CBS domain-containing protein [Gemmataceae bacterium]
MNDPVAKKPDHTVLLLAAETAGDLMTPNLISIRDSATTEEATAFFADHGFSASVVIDEAGRPLGVLSKSDLLVHNREARPGGGTTFVRDLMTPAVFSTRTDTSARDVIDQLVSLNVHQLYVVDDTGLLVGVITPLDVLRRIE